MNLVRGLRPWAGSSVEIALWDLIGKTTGQRSIKSGVRRRIVSRPMSA